MEHGTEALSDTAISPLSPAAAGLLAGLLNDAVRMVDTGMAGVDDVDTAMRLGAGHPAGPFAVLASLAPADCARLGVVLSSGAAATQATAPFAESTDPHWTGAVGVIGSGHMAAGICEVIARSGRTVRLVARSQQSVQGLLSRVGASLARAVDRGRLSAAEAGPILTRIQPVDGTAAVGTVDVLIEAVAEDLAVKREVLAAADASLPPGVAIATNTSSFRVADLRPAVAPGRPLLALHFFNPAPVMRLVEVVVPADGSPGRDMLRGAALAWVKDIGKAPVECGDRRGFLVNRLLIPFLNDAVRQLEAGMSAEAIELAMTEGAGHPMGPLALLDLIGVDVAVAALAAMAQAEPDPRLIPADTLTAMVADGLLGRKSGRGFHDYHRPEGM